MPDPATTPPIPPEALAELKIAEPPAPKAGYKTTEFWLSLVAIIVGAVLASGLLPGGPPTQLAGIVATVLAALGYTGSRTIVKRSGPALVLAFFALALTGCSRLEVGVFAPAALVMAWFVGRWLWRWCRWQWTMLALALLAGAASCAHAPTGGHYVYLPPEPVACTLAATAAAVAQLPCDRRKPDPLTCLASAGEALVALAPCLPRPVWVADPPPTRP